jgi:N-glycosylase/DNA lyase
MQSRQLAYVNVRSMSVTVDLPPADCEVVDGVRWGQVEAFPTPAYWAYQVMARRIEARSINYRLGKTLREEVGACLLGGHGIPAKVGLLAFEHLKAKGAFEIEPPDELTLLGWLDAAFDTASPAKSLVILRLPCDSYLQNAHRNNLAARFAIG